MLDRVTYSPSVFAALPRTDLWSEERVALLRKLWSDVSLSASKIAAQLGGGATRNSVLGKVHRLGLAERPRRSQDPSTGLPRAPRKAATKARRVVQFKSPDARHAPPQIEAIVQPFAIAIPVSRRVTIEELRPFMCRFMLGDALAGVYCGSATNGGSWCPGHRALIFQPASAPIRVQPPGPTPKPGSRPFGSSIILEDEAEAA